MCHFDEQALFASNEVIRHFQFGGEVVGLQKVYAQLVEADLNQKLIVSLHQLGESDQIHHAGKERAQAPPRHLKDVFGVVRIFRFFVLLHTTLLDSICNIFVRSCGRRGFRVFALALALVFLSHKLFHPLKLLAHFDVVIQFQSLRLNPQLLRYTGGDETQHHRLKCVENGRVEQGKMYRSKHILLLLVHAGVVLLQEKDAEFHDTERRQFGVDILQDGREVRSALGRVIQSMAHHFHHQDESQRHDTDTQDAVVQSTKVILLLLVVGQVSSMETFPTFFVICRMIIVVVPMMIELCLFFNGSGSRKEELAQQQNEADHCQQHVSITMDHPFYGVILPLF
mmetsp:Transcript_6957/g.14249  ORF Transcript_6957/g.14249 Transcript_6957/m.14249 type:complete len:340 (+) Transcript_6957:4638-5657(+)